ncbi:tRNA lysidine(34) synthetase TilS [Blautia sp. Sow4_E7]|uniref:tRNA lysidine(34) synthetase TilS n=1 Tax=Blautia sp. Sow4_E7 TaxID=3438749 RepID=UPI003F8F6E4F
MYQKVKAYIKEHGMIEAGDVVFAGVSGGGDSMAMLALLKRYQTEMPFSLCAVHVHHGIRGEEADRDELLVKETCEKWEIPFLAYHYPVPELAKKWKMGLEEAGRKVRQDGFSRAEADYFGKIEVADHQDERNGAAARRGKSRIRIALAHNENDVAETLLHNLCRGTGLKGLAAILPVRDGIVRPVLCLNKQEIVNYLIEEQIPYATDSTNLTDDYTRNKIRHQILPLLEEQVNSSAVRHMAETASLVSQAEEYLSRQGALLVKKYGENREQGIFLSEAFWREEPAVASYGVLQVFEELAGKRKDFTAAHVKSVENLLRLQVGRRINLPYGLAALRTYGGILLGERELLGMSDRNPKGDEPVSQDNPFELKIFSNEGQKIEEKTYTKWLDYDKIEQELSIRTRQPGDFLVVDEKGSRKKLNRYFIDEKIPSEERDSILLLCAGSEVLWVVGGRINENYKITPRTRRILEIQYQGGKDNHE